MTLRRGSWLAWANDTVFIHCSCQWTTKPTACS